MWQDVPPNWVAYSFSKYLPPPKLTGSSLRGKGGFQNTVLCEDSILGVIRTHLRFHEGHLRFLNLFLEGEVSDFRVKVFQILKPNFGVGLIHILKHILSRQFRFVTYIMGAFPILKQSKKGVPDFETYF